MERNRSDDRGRGRDRDDERGSSRDRDRDDERGSRRSSRDDERGGRSGGGRRTFSYQRRDDAEAKRRAEGQDDKFDVYISRDVELYKVKDGDNRIRILPPTWDRPKHYGLDVWVHYGVGPDRQTYLCLHKMKGEDCPICEERAEAVRDGDEKYAKELEPKRRVLVYLLDREDRKNPGPYAWAMPQTLDRDVVKVSVDRDTGEVLPIDHHEEGYDVVFEKKGAKDRTEYLGVQLSRRSSPADNDDALDFITEHPLDSMLVYYPYDHIAKAFGKSGGGAGSSSRDRDDERGGSSRDRDRDDERGGRDRDDGGSRGRGRTSEPEYTWESIHGMTARELDDLIDDQRLRIDPKEAKDDDDLADWICDEMGIKKPEAKPRERVSTRETSRDEEKGGKGDHEDRLANIRNRRRD